MLSPDNQDFELAGNTLAEGITIGRLIEFLDKHKEQPLIFEHGGRAIRSGYHVTEVKAGAFSALDCEANPESWAEIFVQLWDVEERDRSHMSAGKFAAIIRKVTEYVSLDMDAKLTFEVSDGIEPMQLYKALAPVASDGTVRIELSPRPASCKPRDRWLAEQASKAACCGQQRREQGNCCG